MKINIAIEIDTARPQDVNEIEQLIEIVQRIKSLDNQDDDEYNDSTE